MHYLPSLDSLTNNSHVLVATVERLITCFTAIRASGDLAGARRAEGKGREIITPLQNEKKKFVECAAAHILQMRRLENDKQWRLQPVRSMFAILEQFVEDSQIDRSILDQIVAHNLLHSAFVEMSIGKDRGVDDSRHAAEAFMDV